MKGNSRLDRVKQFAIANTLGRVGYCTRPAFLIIGVGRSGSTSLWAYLLLHPQVRRSLRKEIHYFDKFYERGDHWYHTMFPLPHQMEPGQVSFEATPGYVYEPQAAERIHRYDPTMKLVLLLRNPVDRAYSAWQRLDRLKGNYTPFNEIVQNQLPKIQREELYVTPPGEPDFIRNGVYHQQIERYLKFFPREQLLILENGELLNDPAGTLRRVASFVGLRDHAWEQEKFEPKNVSSRRSGMEPETRAALSNFYRPHNQKLYDLLGVNYGWD